MQIPISSGPYVVAEVKPGERLTLKRDPNYWARDLPINRGLYNFDEIRIDYYRDATAMFEAFKAGLYDFRIETDPTRWRTGYDFPALRDGRIVKQSVPNGLPKGMEGFAFNTRRPLFADPRVREALAMMFDFEWINANLYGGVYRRSKSFFDDSELSSAGRPASPARARAAGALSRRGARRRHGGPMGAAGLRRLGPRQGAGASRARGARRGRLCSQGRRARQCARRAASLSKFSSRTGRRSGSASPMRRVLARIGVAATVRLNDEVQYQRRRTKFDFDMMIGSWVATPSPGGEQRTRWGSASANMDGAYNIAGAASPAIDAMIAALLVANSHEDFVAAVRALDRVLISGFYIVPLFYAPEQWIAYSARLGHPEKTPLFGVNTDTWWSKSS